MCSKLPSISGLSVRHIGNIADKKLLKTPSFSICRELSNEPLYVKKFQVVPEIVGGASEAPPWALTSQKSVGQYRVNPHTGNGFLATRPGNGGVKLPPRAFNVM